MFSHATYFIYFFMFFDLIFTSFFMFFHLFSALLRHRFLCVFSGGVFSGFFRFFNIKWLKMDQKGLSCECRGASFSRPLRLLSRRSILGCILVALWSPLASLWAENVQSDPKFGRIGCPFGSIFLIFMYILMQNLIFGRPYPRITCRLPLAP